MKLFHKITIIIAAILLVVFLSVLAYLMQQNNTTALWPPTSQLCPDYFTSVKGDGSDCVMPNAGVITVGTTVPTAVTVGPFSGYPAAGSGADAVAGGAGAYGATGAMFGNTGWYATYNPYCGNPGTYLTTARAGESNACTAYKFASACALPWDGITYGIGTSPCNVAASGALL